MCIKIKYNSLLVDLKITISMKKLFTLTFALLLLLATSCASYKYCPTYSEAPAEQPEADKIEKAHI